MTTDPIAAVAAGVLRSSHAQDEAEGREDGVASRGEEGQAGPAGEGGGPGGGTLDLAGAAARLFRPGAVTVPPFAPEEIESAFRHYWRCGAVGEDWDAWVECFTDDVLYVEHVLGTMHGREAVRAWIKPIMAEFGELYTAYEWHMIDPATGRVCVYMQNRRDHPSGEGTIDFPGITILRYAGDGRFASEEDFWAVPQAQRTREEYAAACLRHDPEHARRRTRRHWGNGPEWTRGGGTFAERPPAPRR
jgi:SnoaL-like protein